MLNHTLIVEHCYDDDHIVVQSICFFGTVLFQSGCARLMKRKVIFSILKPFDCDMAQCKHTTISSGVRMNSKDLFANFALGAYCLHLGTSRGSDVWLLRELEDVSVDSATWGSAIIHNQRPEASSLRTGLSQLMKSTCASQDSLALPSSSAWPTPFILSAFTPRSLSSLKQTGSSHWDNRKACGKQNLTYFLRVMLFWFLYRSKQYLVLRSGD